jgi:hypothetical protein
MHILISPPLSPPLSLLPSPSPSFSPPLPSLPGTCRRGPNKWRDPDLPVQILDDWVKSNNFPPPEWSPDKTKVVIDGEKYTLAQFGTYC